MRRWSNRWRVLTGVAFAAALVGLCFPASWLETTARGSPELERTAVVFGFGFERDDLDQVAAGASNRFLLEHTLAHHPQLDMMLVQEGVWAAACPVTERSCVVDGVTLRRIDFHRDDLDLHTLDIAACALERMLGFGRRSAVVVAHNLQLERAVENLERVAAAGLCPDCAFSVADVPDVPYPQHTAQWRTRSQFVYRFAEVAARVRFASWIVGEPPQTCPSPMPAGE